ncbi:MAG: hypothetical protein ABI665_05390 [Vicinamibacterales bacterium]
MSKRHPTPQELTIRFRSNLARAGAFAAALILVSLAIGMVGYHGLAPMSWIDAFVNAAMILGGMGPVDPLTNDAAKLFAGIYAMYCGVVFIATTGLMVVPVANHVLHKFHLDQRTD